jgi:hypothetical protein
MKITNHVAIAALLSCSMMTPATAAVSIVGTTPAAAGATLANKLLMQEQCTNLAAAHAGGKYTGTLNEGSIQASYKSGPSEIGTHSKSDALSGTLVGAGTFSPAGKVIQGDPYRIGGSVNMFGDQYASGGKYSASKYDFMGDFSTTYSYAFSCNMSEKVATPALGLHRWTGPVQAGDPAKEQCEYTQSAHVYDDRGNHCEWTQTIAPGEKDEDRPPEAGAAIDQSQTDNLRAHENAGEGFSISEDIGLGQVVVCISPSRTGTKLPGLWSSQNGYVGTKCTTEWFNGGAMIGVSNLNTGSNNIVTVPIV